MKTALIALTLLESFLFASSSFAAGIHHHLEVAVTPAIKSLQVVDTLSLQSGHTYRFHLNKNLQVQVTSAGDQLRLLSTSSTEPYNEYELRTGKEDTLASLQYSGVIFDPVAGNETSGLISAEGAVLFGSSYWVPAFEENVTYEIAKIALPADWKLASPQSIMDLPQQEIYLIAGAYQEYKLDPSSDVELKVYLRASNPQLAQSFLNLLPGYLDHYQKTIGAYPYKSFAVIENFWETGFGMPAFTLLGPSVIRLPFILNSSLPHELLHNWWGNSVYVDYDRGNWCEGLTSYLADHWQQEILKAGDIYRRQALMNYQDYTQSSPDFPLKDFKQRFNFSSEAVGYGKGMMLFHMLRVRLGDQAFTQGIRDLYQNYRGQSISYPEIQTNFETSAKEDLKDFFNQWVNRAGAPQLELHKAQQVALSPQKYKVSFELLQTSAENYDLTVPVRWTFTDGEVRKELLEMNSAHQSLLFIFTKPVKSLEVDPDFDVFRNLDLQERPVSFSNIFGAKEILIAGTDESLKQSFQQSWQDAVESPVTLVSDDILTKLPTSGALVLLGDSPQYEKLMLQELAGQDFKIGSEEVVLFGNTFSRKENRTALVARSLKNPKLVLAWIRGSQIETLAPRLLHYGKFGVLVFAEKSVPLKNTWPILKSPLKVEW